MTLNTLYDLSPQFLGELESWLVQHGFAKTPLSLVKTSPKVITSTLSGGPPSSPQDGDIWIATGVATGIRWVFQYNASSASSFKWEFIGGPSAFSNVATAETTASGVFTDLATVGPSLTAPRSGDYEISFGLEVSDTTGGANLYCGLMVNGAEQARITQTAPVAGYLLRGYRTVTVANITAGQTIKLQYAVGAGTGTFQNRDLDLIPVRVS